MFNYINYMNYTHNNIIKFKYREQQWRIILQINKSGLINALKKFKLF